MIIDVEFHPGTDIIDAISRAKSVAMKLNCTVRFTHSGIKMHVYEGLSELDFLRDYNLMLEVRNA